MASRNTDAMLVSAGDLWGPEPQGSPKPANEGQLKTGQRE
jgi:hypothetical protein